MSIIIRLQNLPWDATALNVRQFFYGLSIPDGGVHIIGGEKGDVFIAFSTDEDARQAMKNDGGFIGGAQVKLYLSSKAEMQSVISAAREINSQPLNSIGPMGGPMNQFGTPQGGGFPSMRMPFPNQSAGPPAANMSRDHSSQFRGSMDPKESIGYPNFPIRAPFGVGDFRPGFDFRAPLGPGNDFRPPMFDPRNVSFDQGRFPPPFDQKQSLFPFNKTYPGQSFPDEKQNRNSSEGRSSFQEQRMDDYWNSPSVGGPSMMPRSMASNDIFNNSKLSQASSNFDMKSFDSSDRMPLVMYPTNELFNQVNDKNRSLDKNDFSDYGDRFSSRSGHLGKDGRHNVNDFDNKLRNVENRAGFENEMQKILKNIDERIAVSKGGLPPSLLSTPANFKLLSNLNQGQSGGSRSDDKWRQDSSYRQRSRSPDRRDSRYTEGPGVSRSGRLDQANANGYCLRIENLPASYNYRDVRNLFKDFEISKSGLKIMLDKNNRKTSECFMRVSSIIHAESALKSDGRTVDGHRIRVFKCHDRDFEDATNFLGDTAPRSNKSRSRSPVHRRDSVENGGYYIVIKKLPLNVVWKSLEGVRIYKDGGPFIEFNPNGTETGHILVELERKKDLQVMTDRCKKMFDGHQAFIFAIRKMEFKERIEGSKLLKKEKPVEKVENDETCVKLNGLSWSASEEKVIKFFSGCKIIPKGVQILLDENGKILGDAYIEFETPGDCSKALEKNNQYLDSRYLVLVKMKKSEMIAYLNKFASRGGKLLNNYTSVDKQRSDENTSKTNGSSSIKNERSSISVSSSAPSILFMRNLSFRTQLEDILEFFEGFRVIPDSVQLQYKDDQPTGDGMVQFVSRSEAERAMKLLNRKTMLGRVVRLNF